jgi:aminoglycoside phosphotransferase (APT) family kinase protein
MSAPAKTLGDAAFVAAWFEHRIADLDPDASSVEVTSVQRLSRGVSRQTWTVDALVDGRPQGYIVRRDHASGPVIPTSLRTEYEVYRRLNDAPVPTSRALWFEEDPDFQPDGYPAYVRTRIEGDWQLPFLSDDSPSTTR